MILTLYFKNLTFELLTLKMSYLNYSFKNKQIFVKFFIYNFNIFEEKKLKIKYMSLFKILAVILFSLKQISLMVHYLYFPCLMLTRYK